MADGEQSASATDSPPTDRELLGRLARGDRQALGPLMERHQRRLYRIAYAYLRDPEDALDAVQETFVKVFQGAARWDGLSDAGPWMSRIAVNQSIDRYRRRKLRRATHTPLEEGDHDQRVAVLAPSPERVAIGRDLGDRIQAALRGLPERQRKVFVLRHYEDMSLEDIASALDLRLGTVKSTLHRAIQGLRERLSGLQGA